MTADEPALFATRPRKEQWHRPDDLKLKIDD